MDDDQPYTSADEDPFSSEVKYFPPTPVKTLRNKRSSMLDKWIKDLQEDYSPEDDLDSPVTPYPLVGPSSATFRSTSNPYLAYPDLPRLSLECNKSGEDAASIISYDLVEDDDIPPSATFNVTAEPSASQHSIPPASPPPHKSPRHSLAPSFRNLNLNFRSNSPLVPSAANMESTPRNFARLSFFPRTPRSSTSPASEHSTPQHNRAASLSTLDTNASHQSVKLPPATSKWRPSVLGHFHQPSASQSSIAISESHYTPSRPSISSGETYITSSTSQTGTSLESNIPALSTPSKVSLFESLRLGSTRSPKTLSTFSLGSASSVRLPSTRHKNESRHASHSSLDFISGTKTKRVPFAPKGGSLHENIDDEEDLDAPATYRASKQESTRAPVPYASGSTLSRMTLASLSSRSLRKKKKLIISGIGATEIRKFEGIKRWCESFGTVRQITRLANGDLLVDWRDPEVAETVCRVRAKVFIGGVGSVQLSWTVGNKR